MQQNINPYCAATHQQLPAQGANAVSINIIQPQAYASADTSGYNNGNCYSLYGSNQNGNAPLYPMNYNNLIQYPHAMQQGYTTQPIAGYAQNQQMPQPLANANPRYSQNALPEYRQYGQYDTPYSENQTPQQAKQNENNGLNNSSNAYNETNLLEKTPSSNEQNIAKEADKTEKKDDKKKPKKITLLTDDYIKSMENYLNDSNPKIRLIAAKEVMERFKEDDSRIAHPSLTPLLNKMLRDTSPSVRFLALTTLQLGYSIGNDETVEILKEIQAANKDKLGEDSLLASEILLKLSAPKIEEDK